MIVNNNNNNNMIMDSSTLLICSEVLTISQALKQCQKFLRNRESDFPPA